MKKVWLTALLACAVVGGVQAKEWKRVRIGIEGAYPPFSMTLPNGELAGFDVDLAKALCAQMNRITSYNVCYTKLLRLFNNFPRNCK